MRLVDADELIEHAWRDKLDSRELIVEMIEKASTIKEIPTNIPIDVFEQLISQKPSADNISRQAVLESIKNLYPDMPVVDIMGSRRKWLEKYAPYFECEDAVKQLPPSNPQTKTGHWIVHEKPNGIRYLECSCCNIWYLNEHLLRNSYCSNCGATMSEIPIGSESEG